MTIGQLFVELGFKVDADQIDQVQKRMEGAAIKAGKLALVVNAVNAAMLAMVKSATDAAVALSLWEQTTGGSAERLQQWGNAAQVAGIKASDLKAAVVALQDARNAFAMGEPQNVGAWSILGVDPTQDPFAVLEKLRERLKATRDPNLMRGLLARVGMEGVMPVLQLPEEDFAQVREAARFRREEIAQLVTLNKEWQRLLIALTAARNKFAATLAPALETVARILRTLTGVVVGFTEWLNSGSMAANLMRNALGVLAAGFLAVGAAIAVVAAGLAGLSAFMVLLSPGLLAAAAAAAPFIATITAITAGIAFLILMLDDFWTAAEGGEHVFDWSLALKGVEAMAWALEKVIALWEKLGDLRQWGESKFASFFGKFTSDEGTFTRQREENRGAAWFTPRAMARTSETRVENNVAVNIDGAQSPEATANAVTRSLRRELDAAAYQAPVPEF